MYFYVVHVCKMWVTECNRFNVQLIRGLTSTVVFGSLHFKGFRSAAENKGKYYCISYTTAMQTSSAQNAFDVICFTRYVHLKSSAELARRGATSSDT